MNRQNLKSIQLKYLISRDPSLPLHKRVRKRPYILFTFRDEAGRTYTRTKKIDFVDLHKDLEGGLKIAEEFFETLKRKLALDTLDLKSVFPLPARLNLKQFFGEYLEAREKEVRRGNLSPGTLRADRDSSARFRRLLGDAFPLAAVTPERIREYIDALLQAEHRPGQPYSRATINIDLRHLRAALGRAVKAGILTENPFAEIRQLKVEKIPRHLWPEEEARLREYFSALGIPHQADFFEFDLATGLRADEMLHAGVAHLHRAGQLELQVLGKGGKYRWVPVESAAEIIERRRSLMSDPPRLKKYLGELESVNVEEALARAGAGLLFFEIGSYFTVSQFFRRARMRCALPEKVKPHSLRHTFAVRFLEKRMGDIYTLSQILGHSSVTTTQIYLYCTPELRRLNLGK